MTTASDEKRPSSDEIQQTDDESDTPQDDAHDGATTDSKQEEDKFTEEEDTNYSLFDNPPNLAVMRQKLCEVNAEFEMSKDEFDQYFQFVDNVWKKPQREGQTELYNCRLKATQAKPAAPRAPVEGKQQRRKRKREDKTCGMAMRVTYFEHPEKRVKISRASAETHSHDLDYMDANKRNTAIMDVARREATKGFLPGSIFWKMQEEPEKLEAAGGRWMKISDVRNVQYPWRQQHMDLVLKAHTGYTQQHRGPRQRPAASTPTSRLGQPQEPPQNIHAPQPARPLAPPPPPPGALLYPEQAKEFLIPYLPHCDHMQSRPHVTLTWATSLDSRIALAPGMQTQLSGPETKAMTHYLRSQHDGILIGVNTAIADDPGLNCRLAGAGGYGGPGTTMQPRPIIVDPRARLQIHSGMRLLKAAAEGKAKGPWIVVGPNARLLPEAVAILKSHGGEFLQINEIHSTGLDWQHLLQILYREGIKSIMIEGGGKVLSELLRPKYTKLIDSIIMTIAPTFLGRNGVQVTPDSTYEGQQPIQARLIDVRWQPMGASDMVLCGHLNKPHRLPGIGHLQQPPTQHMQPAQPSLPPIQPQQRQHSPHRKYSLQPLPPISRGPSHHSPSPLPPITNGRAHSPPYYHNSPAHRP